MSDELEDMRLPEDGESNEQQENELATVDALLYHKPVLVNEVLSHLNIRAGGVYIDATFGSGGHTRAILEADPTSSVVAIDWDNSSLDTYGLPLKEEFGDRLRLVWGSFSHLYKIVKKERIKNLNGILADFGTSQVQIAQQPGFSIYRDSPLDMRMSRSHYHITAQEVVNSGSPEKLREIFWQLGEERFAKQIVDLIVQERKKKTIRTTTELAAIVKRAVSKQSKQAIHPATRVFQALRMYVNKELENIESFLAGSVGALSVQGRLVCISFHSLEDRVVKSFFHDQSQEGRLEIVTKRVVVAQEDEIAVNPSARSARLRAAVRL